MTGGSARIEARPPVVIGTGFIALDVVLPSAGGAHPELWAGGTCGNVLLALSYLGWQSFPVGRLKNDSAYERISEDLRQWGVRPDFLEADEEGSTPVVVQRIGRTLGG